MVGENSNTVQYTSIPSILVIGLRAKPLVFPQVWTFSGHLLELTTTNRISGESAQNAVQTPIPRRIRDMPEVEVPPAFSFKTNVCGVWACCAEAS